MRAGVAWGELARWEMSDRGRRRMPGRSTSTAESVHFAGRSGAGERVSPDCIGCIESSESEPSINSINRGAKGNDRQWRNGHFEQDSRVLRLGRAAIWVGIGGLSVSPIDRARHVVRFRLQPNLQTDPPRRSAEVSDSLCLAGARNPAPRVLAPGSRELKCC